MTLRERFKAKYVVNATTGCWEWTARLTEDGYGHISANGRSRGAHRAAYELYVGEIPVGLEIDHLCRVRHCVNPDHLEAVTRRENTLRSDAPTALNAAKTSCDYGHPFDEANTYLRPSGGRKCRQCTRRHGRDRSARLGEALRTRRREQERARTRVRRRQKPVPAGGEDGSGTADGNREEPA